jgi:hypothetical protein
MEQEPDGGDGVLYRKGPRFLSWTVPGNELDGTRMTLVPSRSAGSRQKRAHRLLAASTDAVRIPPPAPALHTVRRPICGSSAGTTQPRVSVTAHLFAWDKRGGFFIALLLTNQCRYRRAGAEPERVVGAGEKIGHIRPVSWKCHGCC